MRYPVRLIHEDNGTVTAIVPDLPGAHSFGDDEAEAMERVVDAAETSMIALMADRKPIPPPSRSKRRATVVFSALTAAKVALYGAMLEARVGKAALARRLGWHMPQVDRVLDLRHASRLDHVEAALRALGHELHVEVRPAA